MRISLGRRPASSSRLHAPISWLGLSLLTHLSQAVTINSIAEPSLDLSQLGRVGIAGDFVGASYYQYEGQTERPYITNGSESLMVRLPNGMFLTVLDADASIHDMCMFQGQVIIAGNFTSLNGTQSPAVAAFDPVQATMTPLAGVEGQVNSLLCDDDAGMVYVGGSFRAADSTNAITWVADQSWASLPFAGFNGPVTSIVRASNGNVIFGGQFSGLGNTSTPTTPDEQVINLSSSRVESDQTSDEAGFSDPRNIICNVDGTGGPGSTWLLRDDTPGTWSASFGFFFEPTKLRLRNTRQDGRGTRTWRFTAQPLNGILNFTYVDPATGQNASCTSECPLSDDPAVEFQEFHFVNNVEMNAFRIDISDWYGSGGGLDGVELFQDQMFAYAVNDLNEPSCSNTTSPSEASFTGPWTTSQPGLSNSLYLSATLPSPVTPEDATVTFFPDIKEAGEYTVNIYTPGCQQDGTCLSRGQFTVAGTLTSDGPERPLTSNALYQTNDFDKYDSLYTGFVDASSESFRPSIVLRPLAGQVVPQGDMVLVAQRVEFRLLNSTGGLNGLYEYNPREASVDTSDLEASAFNELGSRFSTDSAVSSLATSDDVTYIGGNFTSADARNIIAINANDGSLVPVDGGLNGGVSSMHFLEDQLFVGGQFDGTEDGSASGLNNVAVYTPTDNAWTALGAGVNGAVRTIVPITLNITLDTLEDAIALSGDFTELLAFGGNRAVEVNGFAVWVRSQRNWLQNLDTAAPWMDGVLSASLLNLADGSSFYTGSLSAQVLRANGVASMGDNLAAFPINILPTDSTASSNSGIAKRSTLANRIDTMRGVIAAEFYEAEGGARNLTILGGHFTAEATDGTLIHNFALIDNADADTVTGLGGDVSEDSVFLAFGVQGDNLFAGGVVNGTASGSRVNGLISYNLASKSFNPQPPALSGDNVTVSSITVKPNTPEVYVGGAFEDAGSLPCPGLCVYSTGTSQWSRPGLDLDGVVYSMIWTGENTLVVGGNFTRNGVTSYLMSFDAAASTWTEFSGGSNLPGPVAVLTPANVEMSQFWVAGTDSAGVAYLMRWDGAAWAASELALDPETKISGLQMFTVTDHHDDSTLVGGDRVLVLTGSIAIPNFGTASSAIFDGTTIRPFALSSGAGNQPGSIHRIFTQEQNFFTSPGGGGMAVGFIVLIALAISLGLMLLIVAAGIALDRYRKKREGYVPAPTSMYDRGSGIQRIPPHELLDSLNKGRPGAPHI
jgi:hypothetical protein